MSLGPYNPFRHFDAMRREFDQFFRDGISSLLNKSDEGIGFPVDLHESEQEIVVTCNLPGIENKEDIRIDVVNNMLSVSGVIQKSNEIKEDQVHRQERYYGRFQRTVSLPASASGEGVTAAYKNGILKIRIPKEKEAATEPIDIDFQ